MNEFILFLKDYWKLIVAGVFFIISLVIALLKKKPVTDIQALIYSFVCEAVRIVEVESKKKNLTSNQKLVRALAYVNDELLLVFPNLSLGPYQPMITNIIEDVLDTPQKKGDDK